MTDPVLYSVEDGIAQISFNRPEVLNALNFELGSAFAEAVDEALDNPDVRVVLLSGKGRSFMAGGDLAAFRAAERPQEAIAELITPLHAAVLKLANAPTITIAAGQGPIAGAGASIFLGADLGLMAEGASLSTAYVRLGGSPDCGGTFALSRMVGQRKALELLLLSDPVDAMEALRLGLTNRVVPAAELASEAMALARRLAKGPRLAQARIKALAYSATERDLPTHLDAEAESFLALAATRDFREGLDAFFERRSPEFE